MIVFNFTGLNRWYWLLLVERKGSKKLWFISIRFLGIEVVFYSVKMATEFINRLNRGEAPHSQENAPCAWQDKAS